MSHGRIYTEAGRRLAKMAPHPGVHRATRVHIVDIDSGMWAGRPAGHVTLCGKTFAMITARDDERLNCPECRREVRKLRRLDA